MKIIQVSKADLSTAELVLLRPLVDPEKHEIFDPEIKWVELAIAYEGNRPVGCLAAYSYNALAQGEVLSLFVLEEYRHQGIGKALMLKMNEKFMADKIRFAHVTYKGWESTAPYFEKILRAAGWAPPKTVVLHFYFDPATFHPDWFETEEMWLPKGMTLFPWKEITEKEMEDVKRWLQQNPQLKYYSPIGQKEPLNVITSLGLRKDGELMGWIINHYVEPNIHRYTSLFIHPEVRGLGPGASLLKASIRLHVTHEPHLEGMGLLSELKAPHYWRRFINRRLMPYSTRQERVMGSWKTFGEKG